MTKLKQKIILFISPVQHAYERPTSVCNLYMNRFAIEEEAETEILNIYQFRKEENLAKGAGLIIILFLLHQ